MSSSPSSLKSVLSNKLSHPILDYREQKLEKREQATKNSLRQDNTSQSTRLYMKISYIQKQQLFAMVQKQGMNFKDAALSIGIKYATAKTIIFHQREKRKAKKASGQKMCGYTELLSKRISKLKIVCKIANDIIYESEYKLQKGFLDIFSL